MGADCFLGHAEFFAQGADGGDEVLQGLHLAIAAWSQGKSVACG